jgi:serine/threonine-protein kinase RsbW
VIILRIPGALRYRDLAMRVVAAACKLVGPPSSGSGSFRISQDFDNQVISAFGELFNNIAIHGYSREPTGGEIEVRIEATMDRIAIELRDWGRSFDPMAVPAPDLDALPESGLGLFIVRSFMDEVVYQAGVPNVTMLTKYLKGKSRQATPPASDPGGDA